MNISRIIKVWSIGFAMVISGIAVADPLIPGYPDRVEAHDLREVAMLPSYCKYTQLFRDSVPGGNNPAEIKRMYDTLGQTFHALHHYCWGLMKTNRAVILARSKQVRQFYLGDAINEYNYVLTRAPADFPLLPEILTKKGENLIRLGKGSLAIKELEKAIETKKDYWPAYVALSDFYQKSGNTAKAREILENGLSAAPDSKTLRRRLAELQGGARSRNTNKSKSADEN